MLDAGGIRAGHEHELQAEGGLRIPRPHEEFAMQPLRQGTYPGAELTGPIAHEHDCSLSWAQSRSPGGRREAAGLGHTVDLLRNLISADGET